MNPLENEIHEVLKRREPPSGFAERVISKAGQMPAPVPRSTISRLSVPVIVIAIAVALVGVTGLLMTKCASACFLGSSEDLARSPALNAVSTGGSYSLGPEKAEIVLEEYGDYQCPSCGAYYPIIDEILHRFPNQIRFEYHHFPLTGIHKNALGAAIAAEAAGEQKHFWEMHELLYQQQGDWAKVSNPETLFVDYAQRIGLDLNQFKQSLQSPEIKQRVLDDITRGQDARIAGTPTFFLNGRLLPLPSKPGEFMSLIENQ